MASVQSTRLESLLRSTEPPYVIDLLRDDATLLETLAVAGMFVVRMDSSSIKTKSEILDVFGKAFGFPSPAYNWSGLEDWMRDLSWLAFSGIVISISHSGTVRRGAHFDNLPDVLRSIGAEWAKPVRQGEWWDRPAVPFHTLLVGK